METVLYDFHNKPAIKKNAWNAQRAKEQEFRLVADRLLRMVGGSTGAKRQDDNFVIIGVGLGDFKSDYGLSSLHTAFCSYFVRLARSLGYIVVGVNEFYTSKKCPVCQAFVGQVNMRRLYCSHCKTFMHRNELAGHNMCNIIQGHLLHQERPQYLQPVYADGTIAWAQNEDNVKDQDLPGCSTLKARSEERGRLVTARDASKDESWDCSQKRRALAKHAPSVPAKIVGMDEPEDTSQPG
ncbi:hypothetical protein BGX30_004680 [Mortierella sp. GBA39]|nr:hypothetical protein BGX30_004680 [Mortierella sp. GBA39]